MGSRCDTFTVDEVYRAREATVRLPPSAGLAVRRYGVLVLYSIPRGDTS